MTIPQEGPNKCQYSEIQSIKCHESNASIPIARKHAGSYYVIHLAQFDHINSSTCSIYLIKNRSEIDYAGVCLRTMTMPEAGPNALYISLPR